MKKPKVYANPIDKKIKNNQELFDSELYIDNQSLELRSKKFNETNDYKNLTVLEKIEKLLNRNGYIFNVDVSIITKEKKYNTKIAGKVNNHIITLDNDIKLNDTMYPNDSSNFTS